MCVQRNQWELKTAGGAGTADTRGTVRIVGIVETAGTVVVDPQELRRLREL